MFYNFKIHDDVGSSEREGVSLFYKDPTGRVFHTYSTYERGIDMLNTVYHYLDPVPNGRDEAGLDLRKPGCVITISTTSRHERLQCWTFSSFEQPTVAAALLGPVRLDIVKPLTQPRSCPELAQLLNLPTQQVNYHMRRLIHEFGSVTELRQAHHITTPLCCRIGYWRPQISVQPLGV